MNNETLSDYIEKVYKQNVQERVFFASLALLFYGSLLHFGDEVQYIWQWKKKLSLPNVLYVLTQYSLLVYQTILVVQSFLQTNSVNVCNDLGFINGALAVLAYIGVQGQISFRAYALYRGYRPMTIALITAFMVPLTIQIYEVTLPVCRTSSLPANIATIVLVHNITALLSDVLGFIAIIWHVWGSLKLKWELKRELKQGMPMGLENSCTGDIVRQGILRFFFILCITTAPILMTTFKPGLLGGSFIAFQNTLSALLMCGLTTDLRRRHAPKEASDLELESLSLRFLSEASAHTNPVDVVLHENNVVEFGGRIDLA